MKQINLHLWDDDLWRAPQVKLNAGTFERAWKGFGGRKQKGAVQKRRIVAALYRAALAENLRQAIELAKILEVIYEVQRADMPKLLLEIQQKQSVAAAA